MPEIGRLGDTISIVLMEEDAHKLVDVLCRYHEIDTFVKDTISDIDELHYFAENLRDRLAEFLDMGIPHRLTLTAGDVAYIDISTRTLAAVMIDNPELLRYAAYKDFAPIDWRESWKAVIENIRRRFL